MWWRAVIVVLGTCCAGGLLAHADARLRKPLLTPVVLCALSAGIAVRVVSPPARRTSVVWAGVAALAAWGAFAVEGARVYRGVVMSIPAPADQLAGAAREALEQPGDGTAETPALLRELRAGLERRAEHDRERGTIVAHTRFRWRNIPWVEPLVRTREGTYALLLCETVLAVGLGLILGVWGGWERQGQERGP